jgi:von Willebrand factor type A domain
MRVHPAVVLLGFAAGALAADMPHFRSTVSLVKADVEVCHRHSGAPILDLKASDFTVFDEDEPREIAYFGTGSGPLDLLFLLDVSGSVREILPDIADCAADGLLALQPGDRAAVIAFSKTTALTEPLSGDLAAVADGIRAAMSVRIGLDTDINQAVWSAADYFQKAGGTARRAILVLTDNIQETYIPDSLIDEQLSYTGAVLDGLLFRGAVRLPHLTHPGILGFARNTGGEVIEGSHPAGRIGEMIRRIKLRYTIHFRPVETQSPQPRKIRVELTPEARKRYPDAVVRARRIYFPFAEYRPKREILPGQRVAGNARALPCGGEPSNGRDPLPSKGEDPPQIQAGVCRQCAGPQ